MGLGGGLVSVLKGRLKRNSLTTWVLVVVLIVVFAGVLVWLFFSPLGSPEPVSGLSYPTNDSASALNSTPPSASAVIGGRKPTPDSTPASGIRSSARPGPSRPTPTATRVCEEGTCYDAEAEFGKLDCDPSYPDFCIWTPPPKLTCKDVSYRNFKVRWDVAKPDPHGFDPDRNGIGCEA